MPKQWIPLLLVQMHEPTDKVVSRLRRGVALKPDGSNEVHKAQGRILNKDPRLMMFDEDVPRDGVHVARHYQLARWIDGSTWALDGAAQDGPAWRGVERIEVRQCQYAGNKK